MRYSAGSIEPHCHGLEDIISRSDRSVLEPLLAASQYTRESTRKQCFPLLPSVVDLCSDNSSVVSIELRVPQSLVYPSKSSAEQKVPFSCVFVP